MAKAHEMRRNGRSFAIVVASIRPSPYILVFFVGRTEKYHTKQVSQYASDFLSSQS